MPAQLFEVDFSELERLEELYQRAPRQFARAIGSMLNEFAFGTRNTSIEVIRERMVVRNPGFVSSRLRVEKSDKRPPIDALKSIVGSIRSPRFSGWEEQQTGVRTARERVINLLARGRSRKKRAAPRFRLKPGREFESYKNYPGKGIEGRTIIMMQKLDRQRYKQPFLVHEKRGMSPGLYKFHRRKPRLLQLFDPRRAQPKKIPWMTMARDRFFQRADIRRLWARELEIRLKT